MSRHKTLLQCERQYAHQYYSSHNGWLRNADPFPRHVYRLKNLTNLEMLFGSIVHDLVEETLKKYLNDGHLPTKDTLKETIRTRLNEGFIDSTQNAEQWRKKPKHTTMLHEIYYGEEKKLPTEKIKKIQDRLVAVVEHILTCDTVLELSSDRPTYYLESEELRTMSLENTKVFAVLDFLYKDEENNKWVIVDWKTGLQTEEDPYQLALYAQYVLDYYPEAALEDIVVRNEYLLEGTSVEHKLDHSTLQEVRELLVQSVERMAGFLEDKEANKPLPLEYFKKTTNTFACKRCNFYELCFPQQ
nr:PD-(D/E)XK nuclease family protein [Marinococcus luteus]